MNKSELKLFNMTMLDIFNDYWPDFEEEAKLRALNVSKYIAENGLFGEELWDKLSPKILSEKYFKSEKLNLSGIIDVLEVYSVIDESGASDELYVPVELKTGKFPQKGMWDTHRIQLGAYLLMLEADGKKVSEGVLKYRGSEDKRIIVMDSMLKNEVLSIVENANSVLSSLVAPKHVENKAKCIMCSFKDLCYNEEEMTRLLSEKRVVSDNASSKK